MIIAIILAMLLVAQFIIAVKKDCMSLAAMFGIEIILFAYVAKNFI